LKICRSDGTPPIIHTLAITILVELISLSLQNLEYGRNFVAIYPKQSSSYNVHLIFFDVAYVLPAFALKLGFTTSFKKGQESNE
jgi:hypothetical protein